MPTNKRIADLGGRDFYPTPGWATVALIVNEKFSGNIWECACGDGAMSRVLGSAGYTVWSTDFFEHGYGAAGHDFLKATHRADNIVTNPPFNKAEDFVEKGVELSNHKLALLLRLAFLEGAKRANTIFLRIPPARVWVFSERLTFYPKDAPRKGPGTTAYAWFVWDKDAPSGTELKWFKPGYSKSGSRFVPA
jgi:hypothetical protein